MFEIVHICSGFFAYVHVRTVTCWSFVYTQVYEYISTPISSAKLCSICKLFRNQTQSVIKKHKRPLIDARVLHAATRLNIFDLTSSPSKICVRVRPYESELCEDQKSFRTFMAFFLSGKVKFTESEI